MAICAVCFLTVIGAASASETGMATSTPVEKVVHLLETLKGQLVADAKEDHRLYAKYACWCEETVKRKADAIADAEAKLREFGQLILKYRALIAAVMPEANSIKVKVAGCDDAIDKLTSIRKRENAAYLPEVDELMQALAALEKAIFVLHDATKLALAQDASAGGTMWRMAAWRVKAAIAALPTSAVISPEHETELAAFLQSTSVAGARADYAPQSATLQGILKDMYDSFAEDLEALIMDEATKNKQFESAIFLKNKEKEQLQDELGHKFMPKAEYETLLADTQLLYDDWGVQMQADMKFFDLTKAACEAKYKEYHIREGEREEEAAGIEEALDILTSDDARELFAKAIKLGQGPTFLQVGSAGSGSQVQVKAYQVLKALATKMHSFRLASLSATVRVAGAGQFAQVIQAIDDMIGVMNQEEADDVKKRDQCKAEYTHVASAVAQLKWDMGKTQTQIRKLEALIEQRDGERAETLAHVDAAHEHIAAMEDQRHVEHHVFLATKADDEQAIELLETAKAKLTSYFEENKIHLGPIQASVKGVALVARPGSPEFDISEDKAPDVTFTHKANRKSQSKGIISILTMIIEDLHGDIAEAIRDEAATQTMYERGLAAAKDLVTELEDKATELGKVIATREEAWTAEHQLLDHKHVSLEEWGETKKEITPDCEWIFGAFDERRLKRKEELNALAQAKAYLASETMPALLQGGLRRPVHSLAFLRRAARELRADGLALMRRRSL